MNLPIEPGASLEIPFLQWWRHHCPWQLADDDTMRELAAAAFAAGQDEAAGSEVMEELRETIAELRSDLSEAEDKIEELEEEIEDLEAA